MGASTKVLVTGTNSGFGDLITRTLVQNGYTVFATMREPEGRNAASADAFRSFSDGQSGRLHVLELDVTSDKSVEQAVRQAIELEDRIDVVVNNAGIGCGGLAEGFTVDQLKTIFDVNVYGVHRVNRAVLPAMRERASGLLLNMSSVMGRIVLPFAAPYTATKWALEGLTESLRYELSGTGVDVLTVEPGGFLTGFAGRMMEPGDPGQLDSYGELKDAPQKMWGGFMETLQSDDGPNPQDVADVVLKLIETPAGERPFRTVVDPMTGGEAANSINNASHGIQTQMFETFGMSGLLTLKTG